NAKRCNAVKHCIQYVWEHQILPEDNGDICKICKDAVSQARAQIERNETQWELKQDFKGSCELIQVKIVSEECIKSVDEFIPELLETMESQMNPQMVCSVAGLCNCVRNDELLAEYKRPIAPLLPAEQTIPCKAESTQVPLRTDKHITGALEKEDFGRKDNHLPRVQVEIDSGSIMTNEVPEVHEKEVNKPILTHLQKGNFQGSITCKICKFVASRIDKMLKNNATEEEIQHLLQNICFYMPNPYAKECNEFVVKYTPRVIIYLADNLDPNYVCLELTLCSYNIYPQFMGVANEVPEITHEEEVNKPLLTHLRKGNFQGSITCIICNFFVSRIDKMLKNNATEGEIKELLQDICYYMPNPHAKECNEFVDQYTAMVIKYLADNMDPNYVCPEITFCIYNDFERLVNMSYF
ncbi:hypothetical protein J437_LFUL012234, partial [Ladona fulva]